VDQVVGGQLVDVLVHLLLAVRQVDGAVGRQGLGDRADRLPGRGQGAVDRVVAEQVAVEAVTDLLDRAAVQERTGPEVLAGDVVDEVADVPVATRRGGVPLVVPDFVDAVRPALDAAVVERVQVHPSPWHSGAFRATAKPPSIQADWHREEDGAT
jgi:hypothetical protein